MSARRELARAMLVGQAAASMPDFSMIRAEKARRSLHYFLEHFAWPVLQPGTVFVDSWHIHAICEHLEAVTRGQIKRLIINMPFRQLKSTIVSQTWPAWEWIDYPSMQYVTASYGRDVATRDAVDSRRIIESPAYQRAFGHKFRMTTDQNVKTRFENDKRGARTVTSTDAAGTGFGGNRVLWDDPISAREADSDIARKAAIEFWKGTLVTRLNDPDKDAVVVVHQRFHELDPTGHLLTEEKSHGWDHLVLPLRYEREYTKTTSLGFKDPRTKEGELLNPHRMSEKTAKSTEATLGTYHTAAQLQQRPVPRGGTIFDRKYWKQWTLATLPAKFDEVSISVDCSFKDLQTSDFVAIQVWGKLGPDKYLLRRLKERLGFGATCSAVLSVHAMFPHAQQTLVEDKANGTAVMETLSSKIAGLVPINPDGGKIARAYAMQPEQESGNIYLPHPDVDPTIEEFISCAASFPNVAHDDEIDSMTQQINYWRTRNAGQGLLDYYRSLSAEVATAQAVQAPEQKRAMSPREYMEAIS